MTEPKAHSKHNISCINLNHSPEAVEAPEKNTRLALRLFGLSEQVRVFEIFKRGSEIAAVC